MARLCKHHGEFRLQLCAASGAHGQWILAALTVRVSPDPLTFTIENRKGERSQQITVDRESGVVRSLTGLSPLLGFGEGGSQFDRLDSIDEMISGHGGYKLKTNGGRLPIPWIIGAEGWAMFSTNLLGQLISLGDRSKFEPTGPSSSLPLDMFVVASDERQTGCYWNLHRKDCAMGVDGWWPDEGDPLDIASRLVRNRIYWEGP